MNEGETDDSTELVTEPAKALDKTSPERIGLYRLIERLGEGGMGIVYLAEQTTPIRRRVALKLIKLGMDTKQVIARFESERQALALMNHPNVAKVYDAGTTEQGRPYFVMELVQGVPITKYCDDAQLTIREHLPLFIQACEAVHHAHQRGIIHRDIKPSNVLLEFQDGKPVVKVIDFGIAKATHQRLTERTLYTRQGVIIGTPEYMSPEQAGTTGLGVDERTDVYSLGVLLYELVVGALPFDASALRGLALDEMLRLIREVEPPTPTTRIGSLEGGTAERVAARRSGTVRSLTRELRGELEWISMKALEKDRGRRYANAAELASDIENYVHARPVLAGPPSKLYRLKKLLARRRVAFSATLAIFVILVVVTGTVWTQRRGTQLETEEKARWFMEQVTQTREMPELPEKELDKLRALVLAEHRMRPTGEMAQLAHRAAATPGVDLPRFGLLSESPVLTLDYGRLLLRATLLPDHEFFWIARPEVTWDDGPAYKLRRVLWRAEETISVGVPLAEIVPAERWTAGPHALNVSVRLTQYDPSLVTSAGASVKPTDQELADVVPLQDVVQDLGTHAVSLFREYPADFPRQVPDDGNSFSFNLESVRLLRATLPDGGGSCFEFRTPDHDAEDASVACVPEGTLPTAGLIVRFLMEGAIEVRSLPLAMRATLVLPDRIEPLLEFAQGDVPGRCEPQLCLQFLPRGEIGGKVERVGGQTLQLALQRYVGQRRSRS